jgi:hypothetical protein
MDITDVPQAFSAFYQTVDQTGKAPPLPPGFEEDSLLSQDIVSSDQAYQSEQTSHITEDFAHQVLEVSPVFAMPYGDLVCMGLGVTDDLSADPGSTIEQPSNRSEWGALLAPGTYDSLGEVSLYDTCFYELNRGSILQVTNFGGLISITPNKP